jgi:hypothetical protein
MRRRGKRKIEEIVEKGLERVRKTRGITEGERKKENGKVQ